MAAVRLVHWLTAKILPSLSSRRKACLFPCSGKDIIESDHSGMHRCFVVLWTYVVKHGNSDGCCEARSPAHCQNITQLALMGKACLLPHSGKDIIESDHSGMHRRFVVLRTYVVKHGSSDGCCEARSPAHRYSFLKARQPLQSQSYRSRLVWVCKREPLTQIIFKHPQKMTHNCIYWW